MKSKKNSRSKKNIWKYLLSLFIVIIYLLPIYVLISVSLKPMTDLTSSRLTFPTQPFWANYSNALIKSGMLQGCVNSLIIAVGAVVVILIVGSLAAYPMARIDSKISNFIRSFVLGIMMIPGLALVVGIYSILVSIHAVNTYWGIILVTATFGLPMAIYLMSNFIASIPRSLDEAAAIDGAGVLTTFFQVILPQLKPVIATVVLMQGLGAWNEYGYSLYILQKPEMYNITLRVKQFFGTAAADLNGAAASAVIAIAPIIILYLCLQKYFVAGALEGAIKG